MFHMCILGLWKTLEARAVPSWNPSPGMIHRVALNATPYSSCVLSKKLETECLIRSCPQQFWRFWPWMQMAITVMLPHAQGFCIINLRPAPQFVQEKTSCHMSPSCGHSQDCQSLIKSSLSDTGWEQTEELLHLACDWEGRLCMSGFPELFIFLSLTISLLVQLGKTTFEHFILADFFLVFSFYFSAALLSAFAAEFDWRIQLSTSSFFFLLHWHRCSSHSFDFPPSFCSVSTLRAAFPFPVCSCINKHNALSG